MKYKKQFEDFVSFDEEQLLGGNNLGTTTNSYGIEHEEEYSSSYVLALYWQFCKAIDSAIEENKEGK